MAELPAEMFRRCCRNTYYNTWYFMLRRCYEEGRKEYPSYGGRGIAVCDRWRNSFEDFVRDMGQKPTPLHQLDRIDNNGSYTPDNCRWATRKTQMNNRRNNYPLTINGVTMNLQDWCDAYGKRHGVVWNRLQDGWSPERALQTPVKVYKKKERPVKVFLDMDGVLVNFVAGALKAHRRQFSELKPGAWDFHEALGIEPSAFWNMLKGPTFWRCLPWMDDGRAILALVERVFGAENVCLLTSPCLDPECATGKVRWLEEQLPEYKRRFLIGPQKDFVAGPGKVLIDDSPKNVQAFCAAGGEGLVVPRFWNHLHAYADRAVAFLESYLAPKPAAPEIADAEYTLTEDDLCPKPIIC